MALRNVALTVNFQAWNTNTNTGETGDDGNFTLRLIKDGGVPATLTNSPSEPDSTNLPGLYEIALTATEMDADFVSLGGISSTGNVELIPLLIHTDSGALPNAAPGGVGGLPTVDANNDIAGIQAGGILAASFAAGAIDATAIANDAIDATAIANGAIDAATFAAGAIDAAAIANGAIDAATFAAGAINNAAIANDAIDADVIANGAIDAATFAAGAIDAAAIANGAIDAATFAAGAIDAAALATDAVAEIVDGVWDEDIVAAHNTADTAGFILGNIPEGPKINTAFDNIEFLMVDETDHVTPETGLTVSGQRSLDGASFVGVSGAIAEVGNGIYVFDAAAADMNAGVVTFRFSDTGAADTFLTIKTSP